ncbi:hypothetical protein L2Y90_32190 (plasmid) [Burkholderia pyrrocinia]|uniref:hypothetical protein n=1 Tax=Burkholderia pyrrocinia TaxID=60550 RepID=UPI00215B58D6|nr:hypothetical protein [Burkholderia pyrrocinia]UVE70482.1 hypothetical protein L2Y90_32190 [Burkholderia pyrrocinia]
MNPAVGARFETGYAPRIAARVLGLHRPGEAQVDVVPHDGRCSPTCVEGIGRTLTVGLPNRPNRPNVRLAWRDDAIDAYRGFDVPEPGRMKLKLEP